MDYKLLLLDLDGTTVASNGEALPSERVREAIHKAKGRLAVAVVTGRPYALAQLVIDALELTGPGVFNGGAEIIDMGTKEVTHRQLLSTETLRNLVHAAIPFGYDVYRDTDQYGSTISHPNDISEPTAKLLVEAVATADVSNVLTQLNSVSETAAHSTSSWQSGDVVDIHITHELATKRHGGQRLIDMYGVSKEQVIAIGDGLNDIPMLQAAGLKIAMGDAPDEVKQLADHIAPSLLEDGVADSIEKFVLLS